MHLLWFFQKVIRSRFNFDFFRKSITTTILTIDREPLSDNIKLPALFFAACFAAEQEDGSGFEYLVKNYGASRLPLSISLAIRFEQQLNKDFTKLPILKDHEKKLQHMIMGQSQGTKKDVKKLAINQALDDLYNKPVKSKTSLLNQKHLTSN